MPLTKFRKDNKDLKPWIIYVWEEGDVVKGAAKVVTIDGINEIFISGREVVEDKAWNKPDRKRDVFMAKSQTKTELQNTLNALNWYGKKVIGGEGIDKDKFQKEEMRAAVTASGIHIDISQQFPVQKFPVKNINFQKAQELGLT